VNRVVAALGRRAVAGVFTVIGVTTLTFALFWATGTQPARFVYNNSPVLSAYQVTHGNHILGTDRPKIEQWFHYETHLLRFDLGKQWGGVTVIDNKLATGEQPIAPSLYPSLRVTLSLLLGGAVFVLLLALPLGTFAGSRIGTLSDRTLSIVALLAICTHPMVIGLLARLLFANRLHWAPPGGYCPLLGHGFGCSGPVSWASHLALPWLTFALLFLALYLRMVRASVAETLHEDFVRTARAKGASEVRVLSRHVLPNAALKILTMIGMEIGTAIGVCIYIESSFHLPGIATDAVFYMAGGNGPLDLPMILAIVFLLSVVVVVGNAVVDMLYAVIDPRPRIGHDRAPAKAAVGGVI
jgi:peptide/nickel transport system permease protein